MRKSVPIALAEPPCLLFPSSSIIALLALGLLGSMVGVTLLVNILKGAVQEEARDPAAPCRLPLASPYPVIHVE